MNKTRRSEIGSVFPDLYWILCDSIRILYFKC